MKIEIITSFNEAYYKLIGKDCVETWLKYWPSELELTCYVEEFTLPETKRIKQISFDKFDQEYFDFQKSKEKPQTKKFSKKAFSFIHAMENSTADRIIWVDADVISTADFSIDILKSVLPEDSLSTHMGVTYFETKDGKPGRWFVPETGFFAINTRHEYFEEFRKMYKKIYVNHEWSELRRPFDNDVYGYVFEKLNVKGLDLCAEFQKGYKTPLRHTVLGPYMKHYKAEHSKAHYTTEN